MSDVKLHQVIPNLVLALLVRRLPDRMMKSLISSYLSEAEIHFLVCEQVVPSWQPQFVAVTS